MSRETDSSSSGPQGRGGAAYPSGTPPYGTGQYASPQPREEPRGSTSGERAKEAAADEPKTETTLTTRVRINIPGSRPIPPVVVRTPVSETDAGEDDSPESSAETTREIPAWPPSPGTATPGTASPGTASPGTATPGSTGDGGTRGGTGKTSTGKTDSEKSATSDWFAPRKPPTPTQSTGPAQPSAAAPTPARPNIPYLDGGTEVPGPAKAAEPPFGAGGLAGGTARGAGGESPFGGGIGVGSESPFGGGIGVGSESPFGGGIGIGVGSESPFGGGIGIGVGSESPFPSGSPLGEHPFDNGAVGGLGSSSGPPTGAVPFASPVAPETDDWAGWPDVERPAGPTTGPVTGGVQLPTAPGMPGAPAGPRMPGAGEGGGPAGYRPPGAGSSPFGGHLSGGPSAGSHLGGDSLVSGIPTVPSPADAATPEPASAATKGGGSAAPGRKGRSKLVLAAIGLVSAVAVVYGVGLLMDHADVPNGTVVLGTDIGGKTRDEAVKALDTAVGTRVTAPLQVRIGNQTVQLKPELAGLAIDTQETVREVAHPDYNPVSVIGSLFGGTRQVAPAVTVDQEKLRSQLQALSTSSATGSDGMVKFVDGKPVAVPGRPYQSLDLDASARLVTNAYLQRAQTGQDVPVVLAVTIHQPKVTQAAMEQAVREIGVPAMSGKITVVAGTKSVLFSPQRSLSKILTLVPDTQGNLVLYVDLNTLKQLYGNAFDGVLLERGDGSKTPVTPQDVASAMMPELRKTQAVKTALIPNVAK